MVNAVTTALIAASACMIMVWVTTNLAIRLDNQSVFIARYPAAGVGAAIGMLVATAPVRTALLAIPVIAAIWFVLDDLAGRSWRDYRGTDGVVIEV